MRAEPGFLVEVEERRAQEQQRRHEYERNQRGEGAALLPELAEQIGESDRADEADEGERGERAECVDEVGPGELRIIPIGCCPIPIPIINGPGEYCVAGFLSGNPSKGSSPLLLSSLNLSWSMKYIF